MTKREIVKKALNGQYVPYTPWSFRFTVEAADQLKAHYRSIDLIDTVDNHFIELGSDIGFYEDLGNNRFRDVFSVIWDRTIDKDIGNVEGNVLPDQTLEGYTFPDPLDPRFFEDIPEKLEKYEDRFRMFCLGFSLYERAWTMRGMENFLMDFLSNPEFVHELLTAIVDYNLKQVEKALEFDIDAVYFGDDWGQQRGLIMGYDLYNQYQGRLSFWGGLSIQKTMPFGTVDDVHTETRQLIDMGRAGSYILSPSHAVTGDVPLENLLAMIEDVQNQTNFS